MGDHWTPLVAKFAEDHNLSGRQVTNGGCALLFDVSIPGLPGDKALECASYQSEAKKFIERNPGLKIAVVSAFWEKWLALFNAANEEQGNSTDQRENTQSNFEQALETTVRTFTDRGIKVLIIGQIPVYETLPVRCIIGALENYRDVSKCGMSKVEAQNGLKRSNAALTRVAAKTGVSVSLPFEYMCQQEQCSPIMDGVLLYKNGAHVNQFGSRLLERFVKFPEVAAERQISRS